MHDREEPTAMGSVEQLLCSTDHCPLASAGCGACRGMVHPDVIVMKLASTALICCVGALLSLGFVMLYSAGLFQGGAHYLVMQLVWAGAGLILAASLAAADYR